MEYNAVCWNHYKCDNIKFARSQSNIRYYDYINKKACGELLDQSIPADWLTNYDYLENFLDDGTEFTSESQRKIIESRRNVLFANQFSWEKNCLYDLSIVYEQGSRNVKQLTQEERLEIIEDTRKKQNTGKTGYVVTASGSPYHFEYRDRYYHFSFY